MAAAAGAAGIALGQPQQDFQDCLANVLNFNARQITTLVGDGFERAEDLVGWTYPEIKTWCADKTKLHLNRGGCTYGDLRVKSLQGLAWWCNDRQLRGRAIDLAADFDNTVLVDSREEAKLEYEEEQQEPVVDKPKAFDPKKWHDWSESVDNYFTSMKNPRGIPYSYVIRVEPPTIPLAQMDRDQEKIYNAQLVGNMFNRDNKFVDQVLKELIVGTDAEHWAKGKRGAREKMIALRDHYDGRAEGERRKSVANADLDKLFYRNESTFSFDKFVTKMKEGFNTLEKYEVPVHEENKVKMLLDKIQCPNQELKSEVILCRSTHNNFSDASTYLQTAVTRIFPSFQPSSGRYGKRHREVNSAGRGRGGRGRGRGRGGRGGQGKGKKPNSTIENGVDISDVTRWYSEKEFSKLSHDTRAYILNHEDRIKAVNARKKAKVASATTSAQRLDDESNRIISATITGTMHALEQRAAQRPQYSLNGNRSVSGASRRATPPIQISTATGTAVDNSDEMSRVTYDHLGNIVP